MSARILLADDDSSLRFVLSQALSKEGYNVRATGNVATLSKWVRDGEGDVVLSDVYMGDECVFDALPAMRAARPALPVIVMSAQSTVSTALSAASAGAYDYVPKPFDLDALLVAVKRALDSAPDARTRANSAKAQRDEKLPLIGRSAAMQEVYRVMARVAGTDLTVLIEGENGTGKDRVARAIHDHSKRAAALASQASRSITNCSARMAASSRRAAARSFSRISMKCRPRRRHA
jgi:two-component system nitrogen regulation response regulator GlnG